MKVRTIDDLEQVNNYRPLPKQREFHERPEKYVLLSGGYGSSKSCALVNHVIFKMLQHPGSRVLLARQIGVSLKKSTLEELFKWLPRDLIKSHNKHDFRIELKNGSVLYYSGLGDEKALDKLLSTEFSLVAIDELSEVEEKAWNLLASRLRFTGVPERQMVGCSNPCGTWLKHRFIDFVDDGYHTVFMKTSDNPYLPEGYVEDLRKALPVAQHSALIDGEWDSVVEENMLFEMDKVEEAMKRRGYRNDEEIFAVDVGEYGSDDSVISRRSGTRIDILKRVGRKSIPELARIIGKVIKDKDTQVVVDALGLGNGLCALLEEQGYTNLIWFKGAEKSYLPEMYANRKTETFFELMDRLSEIALPKSSRLRQEMEETKYYVNTRGVIQVEGNRARRKKGLSSPNELDSVAMLFCTEINEEKDPGLLKRMIDHLMMITHKPGEARTWLGEKKDDLVHGVIGKPTGRPTKPLPKLFTPEEELEKSNEEIMDRFMRASGGGEYIEVPKRGYLIIKRRKK